MKKVGQDMLHAAPVNLGVKTNEFVVLVLQLAAAAARLTSMGAPKSLIFSFFFLRYVFIFLLFFYLCIFILLAYICLS